MSTELPRDVSQIRAELHRIICEVVGADLEDIDDETPLLDYVTSSLALLAGIRMVYDRYGVLVPIRPLLEGAGNLRALSAFIDQALRAQEKNLHASLDRDSESDEQGPRVALGPSQRHIGFLARYSSGASAAYNEHLAVRLAGSLHGPALQAAFEAVVERYEAARAALSPNEDTLFFCTGFEFPIAHCSEADLPVQMTDFGSRAFEPGERMFRAKLFRLSETEHVLVLVGHALIVDRDALQLMLDDVAALYNVFARGEASVSVPAAVQVSEYIEQRAKLSADAARAAAEDFWKGVFTAGAPLLQLPGDCARPPVKNYQGARLSVRLPDDISDALPSRADIPPAATVFGAFTAFLHRIASQGEIVVGARSEPIVANGASRVVAPTWEMLPVRSNYDPQRSFAEHLRDTADRLATANSHRQVSLAEIISLVNVPRDQSRPPLFSAAFRTDALGTPPEFHGLRAAFANVSVERARYDLELTFVTSADGMELCWDYSTELYEATTVSRWSDGFVAFLQAGLHAVETPCGRLPVMPDHVRKTLLEDWNATAAPYPDAETLYSMFAAQAQASPERIAVRCLDREVTYGRLLIDVERVAAMLAGHGMKRGSRVAIVLRRSPALVAAMLGVWRAGSAYVPIDPDLPGQRMSYMLSNAGVACVITSPDLVAAISPWSSGVPLLIDDGRTYPADALAVAPCGRNDSAYVIYTSGSTGRPKGVEITHRALLNALLSTRDHLRFTGSDSLLAVTTTSFDISAVEIYMPLITGGVLELAEDGLSADAARLMQRIDARKPSYVQTTPSIWKTVLAAGWAGHPTIRVGAAGEALPRELAEQLLEKAGEVWNLYGPTEATVYATASRVQSEPGQPVRIGRPFRNTRLYVLDEQLEPVPIGVVGELYISGDGLAVGYVQAPELTQKAFVPNPFRPGELMYRTGDLARYLVDGDVVCLGRIDRQAKIHGVRIEPQEIEDVLLAIAGIRQGAVTTWIDANGDKQLVAYLVADSGITASGVRDKLREMLPQAMIPSHIAFCDTFPLTPSGKVDVAALPSLDLGKGAATGGARPATSTERLIADIWAKLLQIPVARIGRDDDFMNLGGHSLLMTQLMVEVRRLFGVGFNLREFFAASTLKRFAELIGSLERAKTTAEPDAPALRAHDPVLGKERMAYLAREGDLPFNIVPARGLTFSPQETRNVLLTGASGFLGAYILNELLETSSVHVYCLVRSKPGADSKARISSQLRNYRLWKDDPEYQAAWDQRVHVVPGDIILPRLGLADSAYEATAREIDCIIHSAAHVNFIYPYEALKTTNVLGLHEIIRFAFHGRIKPVHYLSTAAIWPMGSEQTFYESDPLDHGKLLNLGYDEAKWVGEKCLINAMERGLPVARYRPGEVGGDSVTGRCVLNHFLFASLRGFLQFGAMPAVDTFLDVAPVDYVAKAIVYMALRKNPLGRAFHLTNPRTRHMKEGTEFLRRLGYQFEDLPFDEVRRRLIMSPNFSENALFPYQAVLESMDERSLQLPKYDCGQTEAELEGSGIVCPPGDEKLFRTYLGYLRDVDFLPSVEELALAPAVDIGEGSRVASPTTA